MISNTLFSLNVDDEVGDDFDDNHEGKDQVDEEINDNFENDHEGEDVAFSLLGTPLTHLSVVKSAFS